MSVLLIVRGIQGSGKSTYATKWVAENPEGRARVNRDDLRKTIFGSYVLTPHQENVITKVEHATVKALLSTGKDVVVDAMNLRAKNVKEFLKIAEVYGATVLHKDFPVDLDVAIKRNSERERKVPEDVIRNVYRRYFQNGKFPEFPVLDYDGIYEPDETLPKAILVDVDGTVMHKHPGRGYFDWDKVIDDIPNVPVIDVVKAVADSGVLVVIMSGRDAICYEDTLTSLEIAGVPVHELHMRAEGDMRKDNIIKRELFDTHIRHRFNVVGVFDDRQQVVDMYRDELKIPVYQVAFGDF